MGESGGDQLRQVLEHYGVRLRGRGNVCCPAHDDADPSMSVDLNRGVWYCFSCGKGGGWVKLVQLMEGVGWREAKRIAAGFGVRGGEVDGGVRGVRGKSGSRWGDGLFDGPRVGSRNGWDRHAGGRW